MLRTTLAGLRLHTSRYITTMLAILLGVMFVSGTMVFADTLDADYEKTVMGAATSVDAIAVPSEDQGAVADESPADQALLTKEQLDDVRALPEVAEAEGMIRGQAVLLDSEGRAFGYIPPAAVSIGKTNRFSPNEGELPTSGDEIALATSTAQQTDFGVGDTVTVLDLQEEERELTVVGLVDFGVDASFSAGGALVFDQATAEAMTGVSDYDEIDVIAAEGHTDEQVADAVASVLGPRADVRTGEDFGLTMAENAGADTEMMRIALLLFAFIAMFVAGIVIYNTFAILIAQRQREMALLRCVGAKRSQVFGSVLAESLVVGLVSSALGVLSGVGIGMLGARFGGSLMGGDSTVSVVVTPTAVVTGLLVGTVVTVLSALVPALRATRVAPLAALRTSAIAAGLEKGTGRVRVVLGLLAFLASAAMVGLSRAMGPNQMGPVIVTAAALIAFLGVVVLGPLLVRGIVHVVGVPLKKVGVPSRLAVDNSTRSPRRAATAMIALTVGATLITGYSVVSASLETTMTQQLDEQFPMDYQISPQQALEGTVGEDTEDVQDTSEDDVEGPEAPSEDHEEGSEEGEHAATEDAAEDTPDDTEDELPDFPTIPAEVRDSLEVQEALDTTIGSRNTHVELDDGQLLSVNTYAGGEIGVDITSETIEGDLTEVGPGKAAISEGYVDDLAVGDTLTLPSETGQDLSVEIVAVVEPMQFLTGATLDTEDFTTAFPEIVEDDHLFVRAAQDADPAEVRDAVHAAVDDHPTMQVSSVAEVKNQFTEIMDIAFYTIAAMLGLAIIIAVFGISNTMALSVLERTRESALLRALGLGRAQLRRMLSVEAVLLCLIGASIGIVLGVVFGWAAGASVLPGMIFSAPMDQIAVFIAVAVVAGLVAAVLPARRAARTSITGALASE